MTPKEEKQAKSLSRQKSGAQMWVELILTGMDHQPKEVLLVLWNQLKPPSSVVPESL